MQYRVKYIDPDSKDCDLWLQFVGDSEADQDSKSDAHVFETLAEAAGEVARLERENDNEYAVIPVILKRKEAF